MLQKAEMLDTTTCVPRTTHRTLQPALRTLEMTRRPPRRMVQAAAAAAALPLRAGRR